MTIYHERDGRFANSELCCAGEIPDQSVGVAIQRASIHARLWEQNLIAIYSGRADTTANGNPGPTARSFYIITSSPPRADTSAPMRQLLIAGRLWRYVTGGVFTRTWTWDPDPLGTPAVDALMTETSLPGPITGDQQTSLPTGGSYMFPVTEGHCRYTPGAAATDEGFVVGALAVNYAMFAGLSVWTMPIDPITNSQGLGLAQANFVAGETLRGYDSDAGTSVARLVDAQDLYANDSMIANTRRCLFQTPYPLGLFGDGDAAGVLTWANSRENSAGNPTTYLVYPRNLRGGAADIECLPALVVDAAPAGTKIAFSSTVAGDTWEWTSGGVATPALITASDGATASLAVDPAGDKINIRIYASTSNPVLIKTVSLWEPREGGAI